VNLRDRRCVPCERGTPPIADDEAERLLAQVSGWELGGGRIRKAVTFPGFAAAIAFVNRMADVAEAEGHHPDFCVHYNRVDLTVWTHAAGGLTENDFILAAKIDDLLAP
jgi:4a-hydroxytetrahydrobiopterin dehydratase